MLYSYKTLYSFPQNARQGPKITSTQNYVLYTHRLFSVNISLSSVNLCEDFFSAAKVTFYVKHSFLGQVGSFSLVSVKMVQK